MSVVQIDYVSDWKERLCTRLYTQFRDKTTWLLWVALLARQAQDLEDAAQSLLTIFDIDNSSGIQLDVIGRIVGQTRQGAIDSEYRLGLKARILANKSSGTPENIFALFLGAPMVYSLGVIKEFAVRVASVPITPAEAAGAVMLLGVAREAGARALFEWQEYVNAQMFTFDGAAGTGFDDGHFAGAGQAP